MCIEQEARLNKPNIIIFANNNIYVAESFDSPIHYGVSKTYKDKEIRVPICGANNTTYTTDNIKKCNCKNCISIIKEMIYNSGVYIDNKQKGDSENEEGFNRNGFYS